MLLCNKCGSKEVRVEVVQNQKLTTRKSLTWHLLGGQIFSIIGWIIFGPLKLIARIIKGPKYRLKTKNQKVVVCDSCGYTRKYGRL